MKRAHAYVVVAFLLTAALFWGARPAAANMEAGPLGDRPADSLKLAREAAAAAEAGNQRGVVMIDAMGGASSQLQNKVMNEFLAAFSAAAKAVGPRSAENFQEALKDPKLAQFMNRYLRRSNSSGFGSISQSVPWQFTRILIWGSTGVGEEAMKIAGEQSAAITNATMKEGVTSFFHALVAGLDKEELDGRTPEQALQDVQEGFQKLFDYYGQMDMTDSSVIGPDGTAVYVNKMARSGKLSVVDPQGALGNRLSAETRDLSDKAASMAAVLAGILSDVDAHGGLPGISGDSKDYTVFMKTRMLGAIVLILGFFMRVIQYIAGRLIGNSPNQDMKPIVTVFKFVVLLILILSVPNIIEVGLDISDSARAYILDPKEKLGADVGVGEKTVAMLHSIDMIADARARLLQGSSAISISDWISSKFQAGVAWILYVGIATIVTGIIAWCDIMMGITGVLAPLCLAISFFPHCGEWFTHLVKGWLGYVFVMPLTAAFMQIMIIMLAMTSQVGFVAFLIISIVYIQAASKLPELGASLSSAVVTGIVAGIAAMPVNTAKKAGGMTMSALTGGTARMIGKMMRTGR